MKLLYNLIIAENFRDEDQDGEGRSYGATQHEGQRYY